MIDIQSKSKYKHCSDELLGILADNILRYRTAKGLSQEKLAELSGTHRTFISLIERRKRNITLAVVESLAEVLEVSVPQLLTQYSN